MIDVKHTVLCVPLFRALATLGVTRHRRKWLEQRREEKRRRIGATETAFLNRRVDYFAIANPRRKRWLP